MYLSERSVRNYAFLLKSDDLNIAYYAVKWLLESNVSLELLEKYEIQNLVEERFLITDETARSLILKISNLEEDVENGNRSYSNPPYVTDSPKSPPKKKFRRHSDRYQLSEMSLEDSSDGSPNSSSEIEVWEGPVRNLKEQVLAGAYQS
ncbi:hypothetical protein GCK72_018331 [Caenorhabditis remanei]|uniref:Uncharacterized protein n=1 Tax=Caenorhabditis remanei TaxID=31234 RepID=A0A6A5G9I7_CAERE|nr:hypothetical protein GCK72_018331 [Caenorhabditis remanei]KAF1751777.1 hypothetical protein GCK72_018331 [Caenorhabditis remanei]